MLFPRPHSWTASQRSLIVAAAVFALLLLGALVYTYECYYRGPGERARYGTWTDPLGSSDEPSYMELHPDHTFSFFVLTHGQRTPIVEGRWYAGGPNIYLRFPAEFTGPSRPIILHIVAVSADEFTVRFWRDSGTPTFRFQRVALDSPRASNHPMERTPTRRTTHV